MESKEVPYPFWVKWANRLFWPAQFTVFFSALTIRWLPAEVRPIIGFVTFLIVICIGSWLLWVAMQLRSIENGIFGSAYLAMGVIGSLMSMNIGLKILWPVLIVVAVVHGLALVARLIFVKWQSWRK